MVESEASGLTEQQMLDAVKFGHEGFVPVIKMIEDLAKDCKKPDWDVEKKDLSSVKKKLESKFISSNDIIITRSRHRDNIEKCIYHLKTFQNKNSEEEFDKAAEDLRLAVRHLGLIVGKVDVEEILGSIFNDFCIGK